MTIDLNSHVPIFQQIAHNIRAAIAAGAFKPGDLLPSQRTLALEMVVNPNTVQRAYEQLVREGLVFSRKGVGLIVAKSGDSSARNNSRLAFAEALSEAIHSGLAAGFSQQEIQTVFRLALERSAREARIHPNQPQRLSAQERTEGNSP